MVVSRDIRLGFLFETRGIDVFGGKCVHVGRECTRLDGAFAFTTADDEVCAYFAFSGRLTVLNERSERMRPKFRVCENLNVLTPRGRTNDTVCFSLKEARNRSVGLFRWSFPFRPEYKGLDTELRLEFRDYAAECVE